MAGLNGKFGVGLLTKNTMHLMSKKNPFNSLCIALVDSASSVIVYYCFGAPFERTNIFILFNSYFTSLNAAMLDIDFGEFRSLFFAIPDPFLLGTFSEPFIEIKDCFSEVEKIDYVFGSVQMYS